MNIKIDKHLKSPKISAALFDLDGTILNQKEVIPEEIVLRIRHISKFVPTSLVSGRIFSSVYDYSLSDDNNITNHHACLPIWYKQEQEVIHPE